MRHVQPTTVHVIVSNRSVRTIGLLVNSSTKVVVHVLHSVVKTLHDSLLRLRLESREVCTAIAFASANRMAQAGFDARYLALAVSPSWGGHRLSGGPGQTSRS